MFWGDLEGVGTMCPPRTQATFKSPAPLGLICHIFIDRIVDPLSIHIIFVATVQC